MQELQQPVLQRDPLLRESRATQFSFQTWLVQDFEDGLGSLLLPCLVYRSTGEASETCANNRVPGKPPVWRAGLHIEVDVFCKSCVQTPT